MVGPIPTQRSVSIVETLADGEYETVAASQTAQVMGGNGAVGDVLYGLWVIPTSTTTGAVTILDGATSIPVYTGGTQSAALQPFWIELRGIVSVSGPWKVTTGAGVTCIGIGKFTA